MRLMKKYAGVIIAIVVFCLLLTSITNLFRQKATGYPDMIHSFYSVEKNTLDVIALGSSHAYWAFQPNILWKEYGITSYCLGSPQQTVASSYYLLKEALKYQKPKAVVMETYFFWFDGLNTSEARFRQVVDAMRFGKSKVEMLNTWFREMPELQNLTIKQKMEYYVPLTFYHNRWSELNSIDFAPYNYMKGTRASAREFEAKDMGLDMEPTPVPEINLEYFQKIKQLCEENDIELIMYALPFSLEDVDEYNMKQGITLSLKEYFAKEDVPFLFYQETGEAGIDFKTDYKDWAHVNYRGQEKFSKSIGNYLCSQLDLSDHREDPEYKEWDSDYEKWDKFLQKKIDSRNNEETEEDKEG